MWGWYIWYLQIWSFEADKNIQIYILFKIVNYFQDAEVADKTRNTFLFLLQHSEYKSKSCLLCIYIKIKFE